MDPGDDRHGGTGRRGGTVDTDKMDFEGIDTEGFF